MDARGEEGEGGRESAFPFEGSGACESVSVTVGGGTEKTQRFRTSRILGNVYFYIRMRGEVTGWRCHPCSAHIS